MFVGIGWDPRVLGGSTDRTKEHNKAVGVLTHCVSEDVFAFGALLLHFKRRVIDCAVLGLPADEGGSKRGVCEWPCAVPADLCPCPSIHFM